MTYNDFTLSKVKHDFGLQIQEHTNLFSAIAPLETAVSLKMTLADTVPLALAINTEKARSEFIIAPLLLEVRKLSTKKISLFSGTDFNVDLAKGLNGYCDFILSLSQEQLYIEAPVAILVEAKNENIKSGLGQCIAAMIAAQLFNQQAENEISVIYGAVTTGEIWKFLKLTGDRVDIDLSNIYIQDVDKILGILLQTLSEL